MPLAPQTNYGAAKAGTVEALARLSKTHAASAPWGRVFFLFWPGERQTRLVPLMIDAAARGVALDCGPAAATRDLWDVRNHGAAVVELVLSSLEGSIDRASGAPIRFDAIGAIVERHFEHAKVIRFDQRPLGPGKPLRLVADTTGLHAELGFTDSVSLTEGLRTYSEAMA